MAAKKKTCLNDNRPAEVRGLCRSCYNRFVYIGNRLGDAKRKTFEASCVKKGKILPRGKSGRKPKPTGFDDIT